MKRTFTLSLLFFVLQFGFAQCEIPGADMEDNTDITAELEYDFEITLDEPVFINESFIPRIRLLLFVLSDLLGDLIGQELTDFIAEGFGQGPYIPGAQGTNTGLQLTPGAIFNFSDAGTENFACGERPTSLGGYYRHKGVSNDTAIVIAILDDAPSYEVIFNSDNFLDIINSDVDGIAFHVLEGGPDEYTYFEAPITYLSTETPDSAFIYIVTLGDSINIAQGNEMYYVFDELKFNGTSTGTADLDRSETVSIFPNPASDLLTIQSDEYPMNNVKIYDGIGQEIPVNIGSGQHQKTIDISNLSSGIYFLETELNDYFARKKFVKE